MTLTYNHFENKSNQLRHLENPTVDTKIIKIGPWTPKICYFRFTVGGGRKIWTLWFSCYLIPNDAISTPDSIWTNKSHQITSQPLLILVSVFSSSMLFVIFLVIVMPQEFWKFKLPTMAKYPCIAITFQAYNIEKSKFHSVIPFCCICTLDCFSRQRYGKKNN